MRPPNDGHRRLNGENHAIACERELYSESTGFIQRVVDGPGPTFAISLLRPSLSFPPQGGNRHRWLPGGITMTLVYRNAVRTFLCTGLLLGSGALALAQEPATQQPAPDNTKV